jgi:hypothetical protein
MKPKKYPKSKDFKNLNTLGFFPKTQTSWWWWCAISMVIMSSREEGSVNKCSLRRGESAFFTLGFVSISSCIHYLLFPLRAYFTLDKTMFADVTTIYGALRRLDRSCKYGSADSVLFSCSKLIELETRRPSGPNTKIIIEWVHKNLRIKLSYHEAECLVEYVRIMQEDECVIAMGFCPLVTPPEGTYEVWAKKLEDVFACRSKLPKLVISTHEHRGKLQSRRGKRAVSTSHIVNNSSLLMKSKIVSMSHDSYFQDSDDDIIFDTIEPRVQAPPVLTMLSAKKLPEQLPPIHHQPASLQTNRYDPPLKIAGPNVMNTVGIYTM